MAFSIVSFRGLTPESRLINLSQRDTYFLFNSVFAGANKFDYLDPGVKPQDDKKRKPQDDRECGGPAPQDDTIEKVPG